MRSKLILRCMLAVALAAFALGCEEKKGLQITGIEPKTGPYMGGDPVTISGHGFSSEGAKGVEVWFGDKKGRNIRFRGDTKLVVDAPGGEVGEVVNVVVVFDDARTKTLNNAYTYVDPGQGFGVDELTDKQGN